MKFRSQHKSITYTHIPPNKVIEWGHPRIVPGLEARFENHFWDSEIAQRLNRWSDSQRQELEKYLMSHGDFGYGLYFAEGQNPPDWMGTVAQEQPAAHREDNQIRCVATVFTEGNPEGTLCLKPVVGPGELCPEHMASQIVAEAAMPQQVGV